MSNKVGTGFISFHTVNDGESARLLNLSTTSAIMTFDGDNNPNPASQRILIVAKVHNENGTVAFNARAYNGEEDLGAVFLTGIGNQRTLTEIDWPPQASHIVVTATLGDLSDTITLVKVKDGAKANEIITGYLTNESATLTADFEGNVLSFSRANGSFKVFEGLEEETASATYSVVSSNGATGTINSSGQYSVLTMPSDNATIDFKAVFKGVEIVKTLSLSKSKQGATGTSTLALILTNESHTLPANSDGSVISYEGAETEIFIYQGTLDITNQASFSFVESVGVSGTLVDNKYIVDEMTEDSAFVNIKGIIGGLEIVKRFTLSKSKAGYTPIKDIDYFDGEDAYSVEVMSTAGNIFRNGVIYSVLNAIVKKGSQVITDEIPAQNFLWQRTSSNPAEDAIWNSAHQVGSKSVEITDQDIFQKAIFTCTVLKD